jgi:antirestriction protein ArdC
MKTSNQKKDVYQIVTDRIIELLEDRIVAWKQPWTNAGLPQNLVTKKYYRGINILLLSSLNYPLNLYLTRKQVLDLGGGVIEKEKPHLVVFWKWPEKESTSEDGISTSTVKTHPILRYYTVFNVSQCQGIPEKILPPPTQLNDPIEMCEKIIDEMPQRPEIQTGGHMAYYHPIHDYINMPERNAFIDSEHYYSVLFHELIHSTGHSSRCNRKEVTNRTTFASEMYSREELTAEIGACFLNSLTGIVSLFRPMETNVAYIQGWLKKLKNDKKCIVFASSQAQLAVDFILNQNK